MLLFYYNLQLLVVSHKLYYEECKGVLPYINWVCTQGEDFPCDNGQGCLSLTQGYKSLISISLRMFRTKCYIRVSAWIAFKLIKQIL